MQVRLSDYPAAASRLPTSMAHPRRIAGLTCELDPQRIAPRIGSIRLYYCTVQASNFLNLKAESDVIVKARVPRGRIKLCQIHIRQGTIPRLAPIAKLFCNIAL